MRSARALRYLKRVKNLTLFIAGLSVLNALVSLHQWLPRCSFGAILKPSLDFSFLLIMMVLVSLLARKKKLLLVSVPSIASAALFLFSLGEAVTRHLYMRRFTPAVDLAYFLEFIRLLFDAQIRADTIRQKLFAFLHKVNDGGAHGRSNVLLLFIESYGYTAYGNKEHFELLEPLLTRVEKNLTDSGYAESSFLTGMLINSKEKNERLFDKGARSMYTLMRERGYTTVQPAPGTIQQWTEGKALYGFDLFFTNTDFLYKGPHFSFVPVPDQYALFTIHKKVIENRARDLDSRAPLFIVCMLVSGHAPFNRIPPYIADWDLLGDGAIYNDAPMLKFKNNWCSGEEYTGGYTAAVGYVLIVLSEYLTRFERD